LKVSPNAYEKSAVDFTLREHLPDVFDPNSREDKDQQELIAALHQKIGKLTVDLFKKIKANGPCTMSQK
jgi:hypothetical protein